MDKLRLEAGICQRDTKMNKIQYLICSYIKFALSLQSGCIKTEDSVIKSQWHVKVAVLRERRYVNTTCW